MSSTIKKLAEPAIARQEIKKSRFLCLLEPVSSEQEARDFFVRVKKEYPDATHHCTALVCGDIKRSNDDGEPSGTAGRPMLGVLEGSGLDGIAAVVVRWFGGTLLGKGGLVQAYSSSVQLALENAIVSERKEMGVYEMDCPYDLCPKVDTWLRKKNVEPISVDYGAQSAHYLLALLENPQNELQELSSGRLECGFLKTMWMDCPTLSHI